MGKKIHETDVRVDISTLRLCLFLLLFLLYSFVSQPEAYIVVIMLYLQNLHSGLI